MKNRLLQILCSLLGLYVAVSCTKVDQLSNEATILAVSISSIMPESVIVQEPIIVENTIEIPLEYGKYLFPTTIDLDIKTSAHCVEVLNFDEGTSITFKDIDYQHTIYTVAESGATTAWVVKFKNLCDNEAAEILDADISVVGDVGTLVVGQRAMIDGKKSVVSLPVVGEITYPLVLSLKLVLSDGASVVWDGEEMDNDRHFVRFESADDKETIVIHSENGKLKNWTVQPLVIAEDACDDIASVTEDQAVRLTIDYANITTSPESVVKIGDIKGEYNKIEKGGCIDIFATELNISYPVNMELIIPSKENQVILNAPADNMYSFESFRTPYVLYVQDLLSGNIKRWSITLFPMINTTISNFVVEMVSCAIPNVAIDAANVIIDEQQQVVTIPIESLDGNVIDGFAPNVLDLKIKFSYTLPNWAEVADQEGTMTYLDDVIKISVPILGGAAQQQWSIIVKDKNYVMGTTADILAADFSSISDGIEVVETDINTEDRVISLMVKGDVLPIYTNPVFVTSDNATVSGIVNNTLVFNAFGDVNTFVVTSEDENTTKTWSVKIEQSGKVQVPNSDFELWGTFKGVNNETQTIDPTPGVGLGWGTANLKMLGIGVIGTSKVAHNGGYASQMKTIEQNTVLKGYVMAAGTTYTGKFVADDPMGNIDTPWKMTHFGIPFSSRPVSFSLDLRYKAGVQLKQARKEGRKYKIYNIDGIDKGQVWIKLLHWGGTGPLKYHSKPVDGLTVIGETSLLMDGSETKYNNWSNITLNMNYHSEYDGLTPTHIAIVMSSSSRGDEFIGATGSELTVDNFVINY